MAKKTILTNELIYTDISLPEDMETQAVAMSFNGQTLALLYKQRYSNSDTVNVELNIFNVSVKKRIFHLPLTMNKDNRLINLSVSPNGNYAVCQMNNRMIVIDCVAGRRIRSIVYNGKHSILHISVLNNGHLIYLYGTKLYELDPFPKDIVKKAIYKMEDEVNEWKLSPDGNYVAIITKSKYLDKNRRSIWKSLINIYNFTTNTILHLPLQHEIFNEINRYHVIDKEQGIDWFDDNSRNFVEYMRDKYCKSFCFIPENNRAVAWFDGIDYSTLVVFDLKNGEVLAKNELSHASNHLIHREFTFHSMQAIANGSAFFLAHSMTADKNPYNTLEENEFETHLVEINLETGKEISRRNLDGYKMISIAESADMLVYKKPLSVRLGLIEM